MQEALAAGTWWPPVILRDDPDYKTLQGLPGFEAVVHHCAELFDHACCHAHPQRLLLQPLDLPPGAPAPLLVALHGRGGNLNTDAALWSPASNQGWQVALLGSSQVVGQDAYCWDNRSLAEKEVIEQVDQIGQQAALKPTRVVLAGFSQAAGLVLRLALNGQIPASGVIAVVPASFSDDDFERLRHSHHLAGKRVVILASKNDDTWIKTANHLAALLESLGVPHLYTVYDGAGHDFPPDFRDNLPQYLAFLVAG